MNPVEQRARVMHKLVGQGLSPTEAHQAITAHSAAEFRSGQPLWLETRARKAVRPASRKPRMIDPGNSPSLRARIQIARRLRGAR